MRGVVSVQLRRIEARPIPRLLWELRRRVFVWRGRATQLLLRCSLPERHTTCALSGDLLHDSDMLEALAFVALATIVGVSALWSP
jgi:hypothetical protein